ncbi:MAG: GAF domain-containing protein, partial [Firmicutes bacterium]|nr:GAF domain-containing protein [Bacillota bacterium]
MAPRTRQNDSYGLPFDNLKRSIVRIYWLGLLVAMGALVWPSPLVDQWRLLPLLAAAGVAAGIAGPWLLDRFRRSRWYLAVLAVGATGLGFLIHVTRGELSPFWHFYLVMMALVAALFPPRRALVGVTLIGLAGLTPALWDYHPEYLRQAFVSMLFYAFVAQFVGATASGLTQERRQKDHLERLAEVSRTATSLDLNATLQGTAENLVAATDADSGFIFFVQEDRIRPRVVVLSPNQYTEREFEILRQFSLSQGEGLVGWVAEHGEPILSGDTSHDARAVQVPGTAEEPESSVVVPMKLDGKVIGVILLSRVGRDHFDGEDLNLVQIMADQTAVSVENGRLYEEATSRAARLFTLSEVTRAAQSSLDPQTLLSRVEAELSRFFHFQRFAIGVLDASGQAYHVTYQSGKYTVPQAEASNASPVEGSILEWMVRENRAYWAADLALETKFWEDKQLLENGLRSVMRAPLWAEDRVIGLCSMSSDRAGAFGREDAELFDDIARVIGLALHHARVHQELKERAVQVEVMSQVALAANASLNLPSVVQALDRELHRILPFDRLDLLLVEEGGKTYRRVVEEPEPPVSIEGSVLAWLAEHRQPLVQNDLQKSSRFAGGAAAVAAGMCSCLTVP